MMARTDLLDSSCEYAQRTMPSHLSSEPAVMHSAHFDGMLSVADSEKLVEKLRLTIALDMLQVVLRSFERQTLQGYQASYCPLLDE
jgi:hypothetical protein